MRSRRSAQGDAHRVQQPPEHQAPRTGFRIVRGELRAGYRAQPGAHR